MYTEEELIAKIKKIDDAIEATAEMQRYSIDDGLGNQSVWRASLSELVSIRREYQSQLDKLQGKKTGLVIIKNTPFK